MLTTVYSACSCGEPQSTNQETCALIDLTPLQAYRMLFACIDEMYITISTSSATDGQLTNGSYIDFRPVANDALFEEIFLRRFPTASISLTGYYIRFSGPSFDAAAIVAAKALHARRRIALFPARERKPVRTHLRSTAREFFQYGKRRPRITRGQAAIVAIDKRARAATSTSP